MSGCGTCRMLYPEIDPEADDFCYECRYGAITEELCV